MDNEATSVSIMIVPVRIHPRLVASATTNHAVHVKFDWEIPSYTLVEQTEESTKLLYTRIRDLYQSEVSAHTGTYNMYET